MSKLKIEKNKEKIANLLNQNIDLEYNMNLKRFKKFTEKIVNIGTRKEPKKVLVKFGHWYDLMGDGVKIERSEPVEIDGKKSDSWFVLRYFRAEHI